MKVLAGDIGGTNSRLALCEIQHDGTVRRLVEATYRSADHDDLATIVRRFMEEHEIRCDLGCLGVPGPVRDRVAQVTNLPWRVVADELEATLGLARLHLLNDLEANAWGIETLGPDDFSVLLEGRPGTLGNAGLISAGTGLGQAGLYWDGQRHRPFACEGGHTGFAPRTELQVDLLRWGQAKYGTHVSWERFVSGPGLRNLYDFLRETGRAEARLGDDPKPSEITAAAATDRCPACDQALDLFMEMYGSEAGNLALKLFATGGIFIGGGIAPKICDQLRASRFAEAFVDKGRMGRILEDVRVAVILNDKTALQGAARYAATHLDEAQHG